MTKIEQKIVALLADYPEKEFYAQEISEKVKCSKASASIILKALADKKIISRTAKGHMKFYQINQKNPEVKRFRINWAMGKLNSILPGLKKHSQRIILFGSASRGEQTFGSDMDLFVLSLDKNKTKMDLKKISGRLRIKAIIKTAGEWSEMEIKDPEFFAEVKNGITLYNYVPGI